MRILFNDQRLVTMFQKGLAKIEPYFSSANYNNVHNSSFPAPQGVCAGRSGEMTVPGYTFPQGKVK